MCVNRLTSGLVALAFPLLEKGFTAGGTFFLFTFLSGGTVWFYYVSVGGRGGGCKEVVGWELHLYLAMESVFSCEGCLLSLGPLLASCELAATLAPVRMFFSDSQVLLWTS